MQTMPNGSPKKVVIIGGGPAGVAAAFWLTAPEQNDRYQVTLYTQGWRLGGKCASGRNQSEADRIEEHGLHMLMGCYQNAFATLRACYDAWSPPPLSPITTWTQAFLPQRQVSLMEEDGPGGSWAPWNFPDLPKMPGEPGDGYGVGRGALVAAAAHLNEMHTPVSRLADWLEQSVGAQNLVPGGADAIEALRAFTAGPLVGMARPAGEMAGSATDTAYPTAEVTTTDKINALETANKQLRDALEDKTKQGESIRLDRVQASSVQVGSVRAGSVQVESVQLDLLGDASRLLILANLGCAIGLGYLRDIMGRGEAALDKLNEQDFRAWLSTCGASTETLASAPIRAIYDLAFAFPGGVASDINNGSIAAGVTYRFVMELAFGYCNAPLWKMAAGMGDIVFAPLYQVLEARQPGCVKFFSRLSDMSAGADGRIQSIDISVQALTNGGAPYQPLISVNNLLCWPNQPNWDQLQNGDVLKKDGVDFESSFCAVSAGSETLKVDQDFDLVILAIPPAAILKTPASFTNGNTDWQTALQGSCSVATQSLQLWLTPTVEQLGWNLGTTVLTAFAEDYDSWGDMSHVLRMESWNGANTPHALGYFVGCLPVPQTPPPTPGSMDQDVTELASQWMSQSLSTLWPNYVQGQVVSRYDLANFDGSDLYVLTPGGTNVSSRFSPASTAGFQNLYAVGDWTRTRFSGGCFESAIESGMLASRAISGIPALIKTT
jgi:uncharacterized protein with NAD-binding domain and iron-sulfur cluster